MRVLSACLSVFLLAVPLYAQEAEMPDDERGVWFAEVNPTSKDMFLSDCACESTPGINFICVEKSGVALAEVADFLGAKGKEGEGATVTFDIDGVVISKEGKLAKFGDDVQPIFKIDVSDPLFDAMAKGNSLKIGYNGSIAETKLKGSGKAIKTMRAYCARP
jgi:hypothetical protein